MISKILGQIRYRCYLWAYGIKDNPFEKVSEIYISEADNNWNERALSINKKKVGVDVAVSASLPDIDNEWNKLAILNYQEKLKEKLGNI